ncbi:spore morphogenesis/germination protein YwcE [Bacillus fonticola]|uniref:spore morphogenesis/germination protein YwcE n=1 Tax=Bacillus fonticola TaxID=2728853 RepID=UPI0014757B87|nr:spore morphogenesis/germination protein YwcE [Bacillus fonticola]
MDVFVMYLFIATATPLFIWTEHRKLVYLQAPFLIALWTFIAIYLVIPESTLVLAALWILFLGNVVFAHIAAWVLYLYPAFKREQLRRKLGDII